MSVSFLPFPSPPDNADPTMPNTTVWMNGHGEYFVTKNFNNPAPIWKKYKSLGWVARYLGITKADLTKRIIENSLAMNSILQELRS